MTCIGTLPEECGSLRKKTGASDGVLTSIYN
jgi:hypothetical protein